MIMSTSKLNLLLRMLLVMHILLLAGQKTQGQERNLDSIRALEVPYSYFKWSTSLLDEHSYIMFPPFFNYRYDSFQWLPGEGEKSIIEAKISGVFDLISTGMYNKEKIANNHFKLAVAGSVNLRLTSEPGLTSPSIPPSNKIGLRFDYGTGTTFNDNYFVIGHRLDVAHYSNGQADENYIDSLSRYHYANADFSTNYIRYTSYSTAITGRRQKMIDSLSLSESDMRIIEQDSYVASYIYVQVDGKAPGGLSNLFDYLPDDGNYGHWRAGIGYRFPFTLRLKKLQKPVLFSVSTSFDYVFKKPTADLPRWSGTHKFVWHPYRVPWGIMVLYHHGRDYMNIRYLMPAQIVGIGIHLQNFLFGNRLVGPKTN